MGGKQKGANGDTWKNKILSLNCLSLSVVVIWVSLLLWLTIYLLKCRGYICINNNMLFIHSWKFLLGVLVPLQTWFKVNFRTRQKQRSDSNPDFSWAQSSAPAYNYHFTFNTQFNLTQAEFVQTLSVEVNFTLFCFLLLIKQIALELKIPIF